ncbi:hypothetical protein LXL04_005335 [Taraxacum kok-saghyz]
MHWPSYPKSPTLPVSSSPGPVLQFSGTLGAKLQFSESSGTKLQFSESSGTKLQFSETATVSSSPASLRRYSVVFSGELVRLNLNPMKHKNNQMNYEPFGTRE